MKTQRVVVKASLWAEKPSYQTEFNFVLNASSLESEWMRDNGYIPLCEVSIEHEVPSHAELLKLKIEQLSNQKKMVQAEAQKTLVSIEEEIQNLQALEFKND